MEEKVSKHIEGFLNFLRKAQSEYAWSGEKKKEQEDLTQDILHALELKDLCYHERARLAGCLAQARKERRLHKDCLEELAPVTEFAVSNKKFVNELEQLLGEVRKKEKYHMNRNYHPKVLDGELMGGMACRKENGKEDRDEEENHD